MNINVFNITFSTENGDGLVIDGSSAYGHILSSGKLVLLSQTGVNSILNFSFISDADGVCGIVSLMCF